MTSNYVTCKTCGWVHFEVSREHAEQEVFRFNEYFLRLSKKQRKELYGNKKASLQDYENCGFCSKSYKNFRKTKASEFPNGSTISPIIRRRD